MPQNSNLFPSEYSNLCPGTQLDEGDRLKQLEDKLLILRYQMLAGQKKDGQSIAELQNQLIEISNQLFPPTTLGRSLFAGGLAYGVHAQIEKLDHRTESVTNVDVQLTTARFRHGAVSSFSSAVWAGGQTANSGNISAAGLTSLEAVDFATEGKEAIAATLSTPTCYHRGSSGVLKGFFAGNYISTVGTIEILDFATMTTSVGGNLLISTNWGLVATESATNTYFGDQHVTHTRTIDKVNHTSPFVVTSLGVQLSISHAAGAGFSSKKKGYFAGGWTSVYVHRIIDSFDFGTETGLVVSDVLASAPTTEATGTSALRKGYFSITNILENPNTTGIDSFQYDTNEASSTGFRLNRGGPYSQAAGKL